MTLNLNYLKCCDIAVKWFEVLWHCSQMIWSTVTLQSNDLKYCDIAVKWFEILWHFSQTMIFNVLSEKRWFSLSYIEKNSCIITQFIITLLIFPGTIGKISMNFFLQSNSVTHGNHVGTIDSKIPFTPKGDKFCEENFLLYLDLCYVKPSYKKLKTFFLL